MLRDDLVGDGKAEARALADFLGGEEGIEDLRQRLGAMPLPLSSTSIWTAFVPDARVVTVMRPRGLSMACAELVTRLSSTWFTCEGEQVIDGTSPRRVSTSILRRLGLAMRSVACTPSFTLKLATLLRSRREKLRRFFTSSTICSMPCRPSLGERVEVFERVLVAQAREARLERGDGGVELRGVGR